MSDDKMRVLLGIDFVGSNFPSALYSLQRWAAYAKATTSYAPVIGVSTFCHRSAPWPSCTSLTAGQAVSVIRDCSAGIEVLHWDNEVSDGVSAILSSGDVKSSLSWPAFSYGGVVNRLLLFAHEASCICLVRIDPGTLPPTEKSFDEVVAHHLSWIGTSSYLVDTGGRLALRDIFLLDGKADDQCDLVCRMTGIDPLARVTGGGMFTSKLPGIPAMSFPGWEKGPTLVYIRRSSQAKSSLWVCSQHNI